MKIGMAIIWFSALAAWACLWAGPEPPPAPGATPSSGAGSGPPAWTLDARWYYVVVPRFRNGDAGNDPEGTIPWGTDWPTAGDASATEGGRQTKRLESLRYGGDLQGVIDRLPYLKQLGVNALCLSPVFDGTVEGRSRDPDLRHIDRLVGVKGSYAETNDEGSNPTSWKWSSSDKLFLELLKRAHAEGFRVVAGGLLSSVAGRGAEELSQYVLDAMKRWMDPDGDGDPSDGVDGWMHSLEEPPLAMPSPAEKELRRRAYDAAKAVNPNAVLIATGPFAAAHVSEGAYDLAMDANVSKIIQRFFHPSGAAASGKTFFAELERVYAAGPDDRRLAGLTMLSALESPRLLTQFAQQSPTTAVRESAPPGAPPSDRAYDRWRLAVVFQNFSPGSPVTFYGDEVGQHGGTGAYVRAPMWWSDLPEATAKSRPLREDFHLLVEWLHRTRAKYAPLRTGSFRPVMHDDQRQVLAFSRTLPGDEVIVVMNCGDTKQEVQLAAGRPGQLLGLLSPQIKPPLPGSTDELRMRQRGGKPGTNRLQVGGSRQFVNPQGQVSLWVGAQSVRIILVNDQGPR